MRYCAKTGRYEVHHVRKLKDLKKGRKAGYKTVPWQRNYDRTPPENDDRAQAFSRLPLC
ncbi:hypothetical protein AB2G23_24175 (plasmid) [Escherichia coli]